MDFYEVFREFFSEFSETLKIVIPLTISMVCISSALRFLSRICGYGGYSAFSNPFEDIAEKIQNIRRKKSTKNKSIYYDEEIFNCVLKDFPDDFRCFVIMHRLWDKSSIISFYNDKFGEQADL